MQNISSAYWKLFNFVMTFKRSFEDETRRVEGKHLFCLKQFEFSKVLKGNIEIAFWKERNVYILVIWCFARGTFGEKKIPHRLPRNKQSRIQSSCVWYFWIQIILASHKFWAFSIFSKLDVLPLTEAFHMALFCIKTLLSKGQMILGSVYRLALVHPQPTCPAPVLQVQVQVSSCRPQAPVSHWIIINCSGVFINTILYLMLNFFCSQHLFVKFPFFIRRLLCAKFCFFLQLQISLTTTAGREWEKLLITIVTKHGPAITTLPK